LARCKKARVHAKKFVASLSQILPIMPVLPIQPTRKCCAVYNLPEDSFHGMEEVTGSIPVRSTNQFKYLEARTRPRFALAREGNLWLERAEIIRSCAAELESRGCRGLRRGVPQINLLPIRLPQT